MNQYQKVYMNQIHSSSLLGQLAQMWRSQMLCDALIKTGNVTTKAHRVVLVAACPMLQSMDNAAVGSHLEVRLAADIKQEAVNSFLQYLYEGFMMLTEENVKDIEKVARLLQVDNVTKCCIDFYNCLQKKTGVHAYVNTQYKYSSADLLEFRHVRTTDLQKTVQERMMKRAAADSMRPVSPGGKRQRMQQQQQQQQQRPLSPNIDLAMFGQKADDTLSMAHSYMGHQAASDPWERVPRMGAGHRPPPRSGVIEIVEDGLEILQTQPSDKDNNKSAQPIVQKSLAISVSSQVNPSTDVHVVNVTDSSSHPTIANDVPITGRDTSITVSPLSVLPGSTSTPSNHKPMFEGHRDSVEKSAKKSPLPPDQRGLFPVSMSTANLSPINQQNQNKKSFAAGSASQVANMSQDASANRPSSSTGSEIDRPPSTDSGKDTGGKSKLDDGLATNSTDMAPDLSLVKIEPASDPGLDMYVDVPVEGAMGDHQRERDQEEESDLELEEASGDWSRDEMSNEATGNDQNNSWYIGQFKGKQNKQEVTGSLEKPNIPGYDLQNTGKQFKEEINHLVSMVMQRNSCEHHQVIQYQPGNKNEPNEKTPFVKAQDQLHIQQTCETSDIVNSASPLIVRWDQNVTGPSISFIPPYTEAHGSCNPTSVHCLVRNTDSKAKACAFCRSNGNKTSCGWYIKSYYHCDVCDVPLCSGLRGCFDKYHQMIKDSVKSDIVWSYTNKK